MSASALRIIVVATLLLVSAGLATDFNDLEKSPSRTRASRGAGGVHADRRDLSRQRHLLTQHLHCRPRRWQPHAAVRLPHSVNLQLLPKLGIPAELPLVCADGHDAREPRHVANFQRNSMGRVLQLPFQSVERTSLLVRRPTFRTRTAPSDSRTWTQTLKIRRSQMRRMAYDLQALEWPVGTASQQTSFIVTACGNFSNPNDQRNQIQ